MNIGNVPLKKVDPNSKPAATPTHLDLIKQGGFKVKKVENRPDDSPKLWQFAGSEKSENPKTIGGGGWVFAIKEDSSDDGSRLSNNDNDEDWGIEIAAPKDNLTPEAKAIAAKNAALAETAQKAIQAQQKAQAVEAAKAREEAQKQDQAAEAAKAREETQKQDQAAAPAKAPTPQPPPTGELGVPPPPPPPPPPAAPPKAAPKGAMNIGDIHIQLTKVGQQAKPKEDKTDLEKMLGARRGAVADNDSSEPVESQDNDSDKQW
jgi:hypothetical protein